MSVSNLFSLVAQGDANDVQNKLRPLSKYEREAKLDEVQLNLFWHAATDRYQVGTNGYQYYQMDGWYTQDLSARYMANTPRALNPDLVKNALVGI